MTLKHHGSFILWFVFVPDTRLCCTAHLVRAYTWQLEVVGSDLIQVNVLIKTHQS